MGHCDDGDKTKKRTIDWMIAISASVIAVAYAGHYLLRALELDIPYASNFTVAVVELVHLMWWGVAVGVLAVGVVSRLPQKIITKLFIGRNKFEGLLRAVLGGVLLDLCSHGILLIGMQLYKRGASLGQTMAFLIASPWNSLSFTIILFALLGVPWTLVMIAGSIVIALVSGLIFEGLVARGVLPPNPARLDVNDATDTKSYSLRDVFKRDHFRISSLPKFLREAWGESQMVIRWIALGLLIAATVRTVIPVDTFKVLFGPTIAGVGLTLLVATILEVCSEGSAPLAADIFTRAAAPGNSFAFLMGGVATDYTEMAALKETTGRWKIALFLPLVTLPQVVAIAILLNAQV